MDDVEAVFRVVGLTFVEGYPANLHSIRSLVGAEGAESLAVVLRRNPDNPHDSNAVEVHVPAVGMVGHLSRDDAVVVASLLDTPTIRHQASVYAVRVADGHEQNPGLDILAKFMEKPEN